MAGLGHINIVSENDNILGDLATRPIFVKPVFDGAYPLPAGTNVIGKQVPVGSADGGLTYFKYTGGTGEQTAKASAGVMYFLTVSNPESSVKTIAIADGSTPLVTFTIPAQDTLSLPIPAQGWQFSTSIKFTPSHANLQTIVLYN